MFAASYTLLNELKLKREFAKEIRQSIDQRLEESRCHASVKAAGLSEVMPEFAISHLMARLHQSKRVRMLAMRNHTLFDGRHAELLGMIRDDLAVELLFPNPDDSALMDSLARRFHGQTPRDLSKSVRDTIDTYVRGEIVSALSPEARKRVEVRFGTMPLTYSAYLFDASEIWYIPFHLRKGKLAIPVFVYRGNLKKLELWKDLQEVWRDAVPLALDGSD